MEENLRVVYIFESVQRRMHWLRTMGRLLEHIAVDQNDFDRFQRGDAIVIQAQKGSTGILWVSVVFRQ
jgi:hypothetical protein